MEVEAVFKDGRNKVYTKAVTQFDHHLSLHISGVLLPEKFEAHFSNNVEGEIAAIVKGENYQVRIPDVYLQKGEYVYVWLYVEKVSMYQIVIPVVKRPLIYQMNDGNDEPTKTYAFVMDEDETLNITTIDDPDSNNVDQEDVNEQEQQNQNRPGWTMSEEETLEYHN